MDYLDRIHSFTLTNLPDLDEVVFATLAFLENEKLQNIDTTQHARPLVIGSGNAYVTGQVLFSEQDAVFADEGNFEVALHRVPEIDAIYLISASGGKHAVHIAERLADMNRPLYLITSNALARARVYVADERVFVYPHIREPYTYNTSTYLSMILAHSSESARAIGAHIRAEMVPSIPQDFGTHESYIFIIPPQFEVLKALFETKFDELFGPTLHARVFTSEEIKHAKTVVPSPKQCFVSLGIENEFFGEPAGRVFFALPPECGPAAFFCMGYVIIGNIQRAKPPYFKDNIQEYTENASDIFGEEIIPIVE